MSPGRALSVPTSIFCEMYGIRPERPCLSFLGVIAAAFANLPWENISKYVVKHGLLGGEALHFRFPREVMEDHARYGTGGTCFSLTQTLRHIVAELGFRARPVMADMKHGRNIHCALLVALEEGEYLLDPGYLVAEPVRLVPGLAVSVRLPGHRLEYSPSGPGCFDLYTVSADGRRRFRYRLRTEPVSDVEFTGHWRASFDSSGMNGLHLNRLEGSARLSVHNLNLRIDTGTARMNEKLRGRFVPVVAERFGMDCAILEKAFEHWNRRRLERRGGGERER